MAKTLLSLAAELEATRDGLRNRASNKAVEVAVAIVTDLANVTPVDSSRALSNWIVTIGAAVTTAIEPYYFGHRGDTQELSAAAVIAAARRVLEAKKPGQPITISNVLPYIKRLNEGYSQQEPAGMVERAILIGRNIAKRF